MAFPTFTEKLGSYSAVGVSRELTFANAVAATSFQPDTACTIDPDPGLFSPAVMMAQRDKNTFALFGQYKLTGNVEGPLFPSNGIQFLMASIGYDQNQTGTAATTVKNGTASAAVVGATSFTYTVTNATPAPTTNDFLMVSAAPVGTFGQTALPGLGTPNTAFVIKPTSVSGAGPYTINYTPGIPYAITGGNNIVQAVQAPFIHQIFQPSSPTVNYPLPSLTVEKNYGSVQSAQYVGTRVNKLALKLAASNTEAMMTADCQCQSVNILTTPTATSYVNENPFVFAEATLSLFGQTLLQATNIAIDIDNTLKPQWTFNQSHYLTYLTPTVRAITGTVDVVFDNLNDANFGYFDKMLGIDQAQPQGQLQFTLTHPAATSFNWNPGSSPNEFIQITCPTVNLGKTVDALKLEEAIMQTLHLTAFLNVGGSPLGTISAVVGNSINTPQ